MASVPGTINFPAVLDDLDSLLRLVNTFQTTLNQGGTLSSIATSMTVLSAAAAPSSGALSIESEIIYYTGKTGTTFTGLLRGQDGTTAAAHADGLPVEGRYTANHHMVLANAIVAAEAKVGTGSSTPISGTVLAGTGTGTSAWQGSAGTPLTGPLYLTPMANQVPSVAFTATANKASTTTAQTISMVPTGVGTMTLPAGYLVAGRTLRLRARGYLSTGATAGTLNWLLKLGATTVISTGTVAPTISLTSLYWEIDVLLTCRTNGATGTVIAEGRADMPTSATALARWGMVETVATTIDTTVSQLVDLQLTTSNNLHTVTVTNLTLEVLN